MLSKHPNRVCTFFAVDYEPRPGVKLAETAESIYAKHAPLRGGVTGEIEYAFGWPDERTLMVLNFGRIAWQTLGLSEWQDSLQEHVAVTKGALDSIGVTEFKRIGFKVQAYLSLGMSHAELNQLMFGSFLMPMEELDGVCGEPSDALVQLHGRKDDFEYALLLSGMSNEQISKSFLAISRLEFFLGDKFLDTTIKDFHDYLVKTDGLYFDLDLYRRAAPADTLEEFARSSLATSDHFAEACVQRLQSQPITGVK